MTENFDRKSPAGAVEYFRHCIRSGDLQGALSCFDAEGVYIDRDGQPGNIQTAMEHLCGWRPDINGIKRQVVITGDLAMWLDKWTLAGKQPDGNPIEMKGSTACMMKRNKDGVWLWLVDNPFAATFFEE